MIDHKQKCLNEACDRLKALEWRDRTVGQLNRKLAPLGPHDKIQLLRKIDELLA